MKRRLLIIIVIFILFLTGIGLARYPLQTILFNITGEETILPQISGTMQYALTRIQPPLQTADHVPVQYAHVNPYGVNTFLQNEVEPAKREEAMRLISTAGIKWIRQEFTWEDIEIHGKDDFEDRRHEPYQSAWKKYDQIVDLAEKYDIKIMARLSNPPAWTRALTNTVGTYAPPDNLDDYGDFVEAVVTRYRGRIPAYQIWNEPNIYPEWGEFPIEAAEYAALLKEGYTRVKAADPEAIVVMGALAATIELDRERRYAPDGNVVSPGGLSDVLFLQQLYDAGAANYFDVLAMQGYGLWSGPTDRRMQPRVLNFSRPLYIRDVMVRNGDAHKAIWLSELSWNAVPADSGIPPIYGQVTPEQQGEYTALAYQRLQKEWPWLGVGFYWFFKQADEREKENNPQYYFRMVEPDFRPMPVYRAIQEQTAQPPVLYAGRHQAEHWAVQYRGAWPLDRYENATFAQALRGHPGDTATLTFEGQRLNIVTLGQGRLKIQIDHQSPVEINLNKSGPTNLINNLFQQSHTITLEVVEGEIGLDEIIVENRVPWWIAGVLTGLILLAGAFRILWHKRRSGRS